MCWLRGHQTAPMASDLADPGPAATHATEIAVVGGLVDVLAAVTWVMSRVDEEVVLESVRGRILAALALRSGCQLAVLARWAGASPSVVSRIMASLERDGLAVRRRSGDDARKVVATITPAGRSRLAATRRARAERLHRLLMSTGADPSRVVPMTELMEDVVRVAHAWSWGDDSMLRRIKGLG